MPLNASFAAKLGRPDLVGVPSDPWGGTSNVSQARFNVSSPMGTADGRLTAGLLGVMVIAVVGFYLWTRDHQA